MDRQEARSSERSGRVDVNASLTAFLLARVIPYSSQVQQPAHPTAILGSRPHPCQTAPFDREQGRVSSLHPEGPAARPGAYAGSQRHPSLSSQMIALPSPATPDAPWSSSRQYSPGS